MSRRTRLRSESAELLRDLICKKLRARNLSARWIERKYELGHSLISSILRGRTELRLVHLDLFAEILETTPVALLAEAYGTHLADPEQFRRAIQDALNAAVRQLDDPSPTKAAPCEM